MERGQVGLVLLKDLNLVTPVQEQHILFEAMCYFVESVVNNVSQTYLPGGRRQPGMVVAADPGTVGAILDRQVTAD